MGIDVLLPTKFLMEKETNRLLFNLGILCAVSIMTMTSYFIQSGNDNWAEAIGTGYVIIMCASIAYIILFLLTCCTCDCKDKCATRAILAISLIIGGLITAIGYWVYSGEGLTEDTRVAYYVGYTILIGGLCTIWALDIAWDDVKERRNKK